MTYAGLLEALKNFSAKELELEVVIEHERNFYPATGISKEDEKDMWYEDPPKGHVLLKDYPVIVTDY